MQLSIFLVYVYCQGHKNQTKPANGFKTNKKYTIRCAFEHG